MINTTINSKTGNNLEKGWRGSESRDIIIRASETRELRSGDSRFSGEMSGTREIKKWFEMRE